VLLHLPGVTNAAQTALAQGYPAEPNRTTVVVPPGLTQRQVLAAIGPLLGGVPVAQAGSIRLVMPGAGAGGVTSLAQAIADVHNIEVIAADGRPVASNGGAFSHDPANPLSQWWQFTRGNPPVGQGGFGGLVAPATPPAWQGGLDGVLTALHGPAAAPVLPPGVALVRTPSGILLLPALYAAPTVAQQAAYDAAVTAALAHPVDPNSITVLADPAVTDLQLAAYLTATQARYTGVAPLVVDPQRPGLTAVQAAALATNTVVPPGPGLPAGLPGVPVLRPVPAQNWPSLTGGQLHTPGGTVAAGRPYQPRNPGGGLTQIRPGVWRLAPGWQLEITQSGLWVHPDGAGGVAATAAHAQAPDPNRALVVVDTPGPGLSAPDAVWTALAAVLPGLPGIAGNQLTVNSNNTSARARQVARQLRIAGANLVGTVGPPRRWTRWVPPPPRTGRWPPPT